MLLPLLLTLPRVWSWLPVASPRASPLAIGKWGVAFPGTKFCPSPGSSSPSQRFPGKPTFLRILISGNIKTSAVQLKTVPLRGQIARSRRCRSPKGAVGISKPQKEKRGARKIQADHYYSEKPEVQDVRIVKTPRSEFRSHTEVKKPDEFTLFSSISMASAYQPNVLKMRMDFRGVGKAVTGRNHQGALAV